MSELTGKITGCNVTDNEIRRIKMSELIGKVTSCNVTNNGISFSVTNGTETGVDAINKTYRDLCGTTTGYENSLYYPGYSFSKICKYQPFTAYGSVPKYRPFTAYAPVPRISDVKVYNDKVVKVFFNDGTTETAVCQKGDKFDLDMGITVCIMKKMLGRNEYFRMLKKAKKNAATRRELEKKSAEAVETRKRQRAKKEAKNRARREKRNKELAAAIANAMNTKKKA